VAARELGARHPRLARLIELAHPIERIIPDQRPLTDLVVRTVVAQLVSTAAARTIMERLLAAFGTADGVVAWAMATPGDDPSEHGLSRGKRRTIAAWGRYVAERGDPREAWQGLDADALIKEITSIKGLGPWSAQMVAIFGFGHPGIWPEGDVAVVRAAGVVFRRMKPATIRRLIAGYETHVALCCWALIDQRRLHEFD
jgi:DNA-3-methyladenine glycosylase II